MLKRKCIHVVVLLLSCSLSFAQSNEPETTWKPVVTGKDVYYHRIGDVPFIRVGLMGPLNRGPEQCINVRVVVSAEGLIISAIPDSKSPPQLRNMAQEEILSLRYRPFRQHGQPQVVEFDECVAVLPQKMRPLEHAPFPEIRDWNSVRIRLSRSPCFGTCPQYSVEIRGDGSVLYEGQTFPMVGGSQHTSVSQESVRQLVGLFREADYFSLNDEYSVYGFDMPTSTISLEIDGKSKSIKDKGGLQIGMPMSVFRLETAVDQFADTKRWLEDEAWLHRWD